MGASNELRYLEYGDEELAYLAARDPKLGAIIEAVGHVQREATPDLFAALVNCIVG